MTNHFLFVLGRNHALSRAELQPFCHEVLYDPEKSLLIAENLRFENPRNIPREPEQLFLDRLGGTIRMGEILGEFRTPEKLKERIFQTAQNVKPEGKLHLGVSAWGTGRNFLKSFLPELKNHCRNRDRNARIVNAPGKNLDSGKIFGEKLLRKGFEFLIWQKNDTYLLAKTVANQNLRNYTLRDRDKQFRDSKMGMLPPKLAQILINLTKPHFDETIIDPFCGSGTVNIEAAILGYNTIGSDLLHEHVEHTKENFQQMAEKFRYEPSAGQFLTHDASTFPYAKYTKAVLVTEGTLGYNFERLPLKSTLEKEASEILRLWENIFQSLHESRIQTVVFCLPAWRLKSETISITKNLFERLQKSAYRPQNVTPQDLTYMYARPGAYVGREICIMKRKN